MESGTGKIVTIAIPTYNRAKILQEALEYLLPECINFKNEIELIISDNGSTDETESVIVNAKQNFKELNIIHNTNKDNQGFSGNFRKCISLSTGKYVWILSDDDFVNKGVISKIVETLNKEIEIGILFLEFLKKVNNKEPFKTNFYNSKELIQKSGNRISLISGVIFNKKGVDLLQLEHFKDNELIGLVPVFNTLLQFNKHVILEGNSLKIRYNPSVSFNPLKVFIFDLNLILNELPIFYNKRIVNSFLCTNILNHYIPWKFKGMYKHEKINDKFIFNLYKNYWTYWLFLFPFVLLPKFTPLNMAYKLKKMMDIIIINRYIGLN